MPPPKPALNGFGVVRAGLVGAVAEHQLVHPGVQRFDDRLGAGKVHIRHKEGDGLLVEALGQAKFFEQFPGLPFDRVGSLAGDNFIKVVDQDRFLNSLKTVG